MTVIFRCECDHDFSIKLASCLATLIGVVPGCDYAAGLAIQQLWSRVILDAKSFSLVDKLYSYCSTIFVHSLTACL